MANVCDNTFTVMMDGEEGSEEQFATFKERVQEAYDEAEDSYPLLGALYPVDDAADDTAAWAAEHWGTKGEVAASVDDIDDEEKLVFFFESPWTPPLAWMEKLTAEYPHLIFKLQYDEPGEAFMGVAAGVSGEFRHATVNYW